MNLEIRALAMQIAELATQRDTAADDQRLWLTPAEALRLLALEGAKHDRRRRIFEKLRALPRIRTRCGMRGMELVDASDWLALMRQLARASEFLEDWSDAAEVLLQLSAGNCRSDTPRFSGQIEASGQNSAGKSAGKALRSSGSER